MQRFQVIGDKSLVSNDPAACVFGNGGGLLSMVFMNLAKISANGQITVPAEIRSLLGLKSEDKILFSAILFPHTKVAQTLLYVTEHHDVVLCDRNIYELLEVLNRKKPDKLPDAEVFLAELSYELIPAAYHAEKLIRDVEDQPILNAAIIADVGVILTGDKDFLCLEMEHPKCMSVADFSKII